MPGDYSSRGFTFTFQLAIDFAAQEDGSSGQIEPQHQNDQRSQRTVRRAV
jgi:hypothetical protein